MTYNPLKSEGEKMKDAVELLGEIAEGVQEQDEPKVLRAMKGVMEMAIADAQLAAAQTAIDSNLNKLREMDYIYKVLKAERGIEYADELFERARKHVAYQNELEKDAEADPNGL